MRLNSRKHIAIDLTLRESVARAKRVALNNEQGENDTIDSF